MTWSDLPILYGMVEEHNDSAHLKVLCGEFTVDCFRVRHRDTESFAFSFESQVRRHLLPDRLSALGVPDGPVRKDLAEGRSVVLADGRTIDSEDVLGPPEGRKKLVVAGDTETTDGLAEHVREADLMVIEATFLERDAAMAPRLRPSHRGESGRTRCGRRREATRPYAHLRPLHRRGDPRGGGENISELPTGNRPRSTGGLKRCR
jgi:hypothetical protein